MNGTAAINKTAVFPNGKYGHLNHSYFFFNDTVKGWGWTDIFSFWNEFNRNDEQLKHLETALVSILAAASLIINLLFIMLYAAKKELRIVTNFFVLNVCIASLIFVPVGILLGAARLQPEWPYGDVGCKSIMAVFISMASVKVWIMALLAIERLIKIVYRNRTPVSMNQSILIVVFVAWILPAVCYLPMIILAVQEAVVPFGRETRRICTLMTHKSDVISNSMVLFGVTFVVHYLVPILILAGCYISILVKLKHNFSKINSQRCQSFHTKARLSHNRTRKTVLLLITMMIGTIVMWIPLFFMLGAVTVDTARQTYTVRSQHFVWVLISVLANTIINPLLYAFTTDKVRAAMSEFCVCIKAHTVGSLMEKIGTSNSLNKRSTISQSS